MAASNVIVQQPNGVWAHILTDLVNGVHTLVVNLAPGSTGLFADGTVAAPSIAFQSEPGLGLYRVGAGEMAVAALGANVADFKGVASAVNYLEFDNALTGFGPRVQAAGSDTNIPLVLSPKATGALQAQRADGTAAGGDARGPYALDLQRQRTGSSRVASGEGSVILTGIDNTASGRYSSVLAGRYVTDDGLSGVLMWGCDNGSAQGRWQAGEQVLGRQTSAAASTRLTATGATANTVNTVNLPNNGTYMLRLLIVAEQVSGTAGTAGDCAGWDATALIKRGANAAATVLTGSSGASLVPTYNDAAAAAWRIALAADTTNGGLSVSGVGEANKTINWTVRVMLVSTRA